MSKELIDIEDLRQDNLNFNKGTDEGEVLNDFDFAEFERELID